MKKLFLSITLVLIFILGYSQNDTTESKKLTYELIGFVNLNSIFDFNGLDNFDDFTTSQIPINPTPYENSFRYHMTARQSRIGISSNYSSPWGNIHGFVSGDFYSGSTGSTSYFRLREAYLQIGNLLLGQTNTSFGNIDVVPRTVDFEGPNSAPVLRNPMIKYSRMLGKEFSFSLAIEMRGTDIKTFPNTGQPFNVMPCLVGNINKKGEWGVVTLSGMADNKRYFDPDTTQQSVWGYGGAASAIINTWNQNHFSFFIVGGNGISDFISDLSGLGYNAVPDISTKKLHVLLSYGGFVGYTQYWSDKFSSNFIFSYIELEKSELLANTDFNCSKYILANFFYDPFPKFSFGLEYIYGELFVQNDQNGDANRLQFLAQYNF